MFFKSLVFMFKDISIAFNRPKYISISLNEIFLDNTGRKLLGLVSLPSYHIIVTFNKKCHLKLPHLLENFRRHEKYFYLHMDLMW